MRTLSKILFSITLASLISACYVRARPAYYAHRDCYRGEYWDGYHCYRRW